MYSKMITIRSLLHTRKSYIHSFIKQCFYSTEWNKSNYLLSKENLMSLHNFKMNEVKQRIKEYERTRSFTDDRKKHN